MTELLTTEQIRAHLGRLTYKPGWSFEVRDAAWEGPFVRILVEVEDSYSPGATTILGINSFIPAVTSPEALEHWLLQRIIRIESHEAREFFKRDGQVVFDPHADGQPFGC